MFFRFLVSWNYSKEPRRLPKQSQSPPKTHSKTSPSVEPIFILENPEHDPKNGIQNHVFCGRRAWGTLIQAVLASSLTQNRSKMLPGVSYMAPRRPRWRADGSRRSPRQPLWLPFWVQDGPQQAQMSLDTCPRTLSIAACVDRAPKGLWTEQHLINMHKDLSKDSRNPLPDLQNTFTGASLERPKWDFVTCHGKYGSPVRNPGQHGMSQCGSEHQSKRSLMATKVLEQKSK